MTRPVATLCGCLLVLGTGLVQGVWTDRWRRSQELAAAAARLEEKMPGDLGPWKTEPVDLDPGALKAAGAVGHWARTYRHNRSGESVTLILLCGRSGQISVHRPEHCYRSAGYEMLTAPTLYKLRASAEPLGEFWTALFRKQEADGLTQLRIVWSWFAGNAWSAPDNPRLAFARYPALYKLYVIHEVPLTQDAVDDDPAVELMRRLIPELSAALSVH
jgi:hypothetical protein